MSLFHKKSFSNLIHRKNDTNDGFTMLEMVIVLAIMAILMLLVSVGLEGYNNAADRIERNEVAESSYYAVQSYLAMMKRQGDLEEFTNSVKIYNLSNFGDEMVLTNAQNRVVIESNYEGADFDTYYTNDYEVQHQNSEFVCMRLDAGEDVIRQSNPLYSILFGALKDQDVMEHSFLVEFDGNSGIVRSVFYSKDADSLDYHFLQEEESRQENVTDVIDRNTASLDKKRQGYCGILETNGYRDNFALMEPQNFMLVNNDRLYLTWDEANAAEPDFMNGTYSLDNLIYEVNLYNKEGDLVAVYDLPRRELDKDLNGTKAGILNHIDDMGDEIQDESNTMVTRAGYADLPLEEAEDGVAGEKYYVLLECLDHTFMDSGYDFAADDEIYATLSLYYQEDTPGAERKVGFDETVVSNVESVYYADVLEEDGDKEFTLAYSRHLWNVRNGLYTEDYRLVADIDWGNIEERARDIAFTSTVFKDEAVLGLTHGFQGNFSGAKESSGGVAEVYRNAVAHEIRGITIYEEANIQVGLFAFNQGTISDVIFSDFAIEGARHVGSVTGINEGTIQNICVVDAEVTGNSELGGISGSNKGTIKDSVVASTVDVVLPTGTDKISTGTVGRYVGGAVGYQYATGTISNISSGVLVDETTGMTLVDDWEGKTGSAYVTAKRNASDVTGIRAVGGIVGEIEDGAGEFINLYNYAKLNATYVDKAERTARGDTESHMYQFFGGIVGRLHTSNTLSNCENHAVVALDFKENGAVCDANEIYDYIITESADGSFYNNPRYIGGIAGYSIGTVVDCTTQYTTHGTLEEELAAYQKIVNREDGVYVGSGVGGIVGLNAGTLLYTDAYTAGDMHVVVRGTKSVGGMVGQAISGSIQNNGTELKIEGVVASHLEHAGGVVAYAGGGTIGGIYTNNSYVMAENAGGIAGYLGETLTLADSNNTGVVYGRGNATDTRGYVGGVIGYNKGNATNCTNTGIVTITHLLDAIPETAPETDGTYADIGGVVGWNVGTVHNCHSKLNADGNNYIVGNNGCYTGGLVGRNNYDGSSLKGVVTTDTMEEVTIPIIVGTIKQTDIRHRTGGVIGAASGAITLKDFHYSGKINVKSVIEYSDTGVGGIIGVLSDNQEISGCIFSGIITSKSNKTGGLVGNMAGGVITSTNVVKSTALISGANHTGGIIGCHCATNTESYVDVLETRAQVIGTQYVGGCAGSVLDSSTFSLNGRKNYAHVNGEENVGGIAGLFITVNSVEAVDVQNQGLIEGATSVGGIIGKTSNNNDSTEYVFEKMVNEGNVVAINATSNSIGGLIGKNASVVKLSECSNNGTIGSNDENCTVNYVGGLIGTNHRNVSLASCNNSSEVTGTTCVAGFIGATYEHAVYVKLDNCINKSTASIIATKRVASGFVGRADGTEANNTKLTMSGCVNYAQLDAPNYIGGMLGHGFYSVIQISECHNYGVIGKYAEDKWAIGKTGGIAGYVEGSTSMSEGYVKNCTQNADIFSIGANGEAAGIIGGMACPMLIENCSYGTDEQNYKLYYVANAKRIGGIVGNSAANLKIKSCSSHADMYGAYALQQAGGIVGFVSKADFSIYDTTNYGNIGENASEVTHVGGILGESKLDTYEEEASGIMDSCTQMGQIYNVSNHVGGMLGQNDFYDITMTNCNNGSADVTDSGKIHISVANVPGTVGGLIGGSEGLDAADTHERNLAISSSNNYGELYIAESAGLTRYVGGLIGNTTHYIMMGTSTDAAVAPCENYGNICGDAGATASYVGGIIGRATSIYGVLVDEDNSDDNAMSMIFYANNHAAIGENMAGISNAGGIIGNLDQPAGGLMCVNTGKLCSVKDTAVANYGSGGIIGYASGMTVVLQGCVNGDSESGEAEVIEPIGETQKIGGIIGGIGREDGQLVYAAVGDCMNYADIKMNYDTQHVGGIVGYQDAQSIDAVMNTYNYGDIIASGADIEYVGGITGNGGGMTLQIGVCYQDGVSTDVDRICRNYGDLRFEAGSTGRYVGGMVGYAKNATFYGGHNEGDIIPDDTGSYASVVGGVAGWLHGTTLIQDVNQMGNMKHVVFDSIQVTAGGIVGLLEGTATVKNTNNGSKEALDAGTNAGYISVDVNTAGNKPEMVGGIIGRNSATLELFGCNNYGTIESSYTIYDVGGIIGRNEGSATIGKADGSTFGANNYGDIIASVNTSIRNVGGIVGRATSHITMYDCNNNGRLAPDNKGIVTIAGGIIGELGGAADGVSVIERCTQNAAVYNVGDDYYAGAGGIVGYVTCPLNVNSCTNNGDIYIAGVGQRSAGIVGGVNGETTVNDCISKGNITIGNWGQYIGGVAGHVDKKLTVIDSINEGNITSNSNLFHSGGIIGRIEASADEALVTGSQNKGILTVTGNCENVGGIAGSNGAVLTVESSTNSGNVSGNGNFVNVGGILGQQSVAATLNGVTNEGTVSVANIGTNVGGLIGYSLAQLEIKSSTNAGNVESGNEFHFAGGAVGHAPFVVADAEYPLTLYEVKNTGAITVTNNCFNSGGVIGAFYAPRTVAIDKCENYGAITTNGNGTNLGGIIGINAGTSQIGTLEEDGSFGAKNFGKIQTNGADSKNAGGIIGQMISSTYVNKCENYGEVTLGSGGVLSNVGGIIGYAEGDKDVTITSTGQFSNIKGSTNTGGFIGADIHVGNMLIENCFVIGSQECGDGNAGAFMGSKNNRLKLTIKDSYGRTDITKGNGLIGASTDLSGLAGTTFRGGSNGVITYDTFPTVYATLCTVYGGLDRAWDNGDWYENTRYLMRNYQE